MLFTARRTRAHPSICLRPCRSMGEAAGVPLEPPPQTALVDSLLSASDRVLAAGVPGAGGYDAVFAICRGSSSRDCASDEARPTIDGLFGGVAPATVSPCLCSCGPAMGAAGAGVQLGRTAGA